MNLLLLSQALKELTVPSATSFFLGGGGAGVQIVLTKINRCVHLFVHYSVTRVVRLIAAVFKTEWPLLVVIY